MEMLSIRMRKVCWIAVAAIVFCAATGIAENSTDGDRAESSKAVQDYVLANNTTIKSRFRETGIVVRLAGEAEVPAATYDEWLSLFGFGTGTGAAAAVYPASFLIAGAVFIAPLTAIGYSHEKGIWDRTHDALVEFNFTQAIEDSLIRRLSKAGQMQPIPGGVIEIRIGAFGLIGDSYSNHCLIADADLFFTGEEGAKKHQRFRISNRDRTESAPPPQCASLGRFAEDSAQLVTNTLTEYAEVLGFVGANLVLKREIN